MSLHLKGLEVADCMCGGGGSTTGMWRFFRREAIPIARFVAINHEPKAIETHERNHPGVVHYCQDFESVNLREAFPRGRCDFAWVSTSCTQHSRARGGRPIEDQLREGPWHVVNFVSEIYVARLAIENVPEFTDWAPLGANGRPLRTRRGEIFEAWKRTMETWYDFEWRVHNAADFGGGTTRERFIALLRHKRLNGPILWAVPTHARDGHGDLFSGHRERWRGAHEFLDFTISSRPIVGRRIPLAAPTLSRALHGILTFWGVSAARAFTPDIRDAAYEGLAYVRAALASAQDEHEPRKRRARARRTAVKPAARARKRPIDRARRLRRIERLRTAVTRYEALIERVEAFLAQPAGREGALRPFIVNLRGTHATALSSTSTSLDDPMPGVTAGGGHVALASPSLHALVGTNRTNNVARPDSKPLGGVTASAYAGGHFVVLPAAAALETLVGGNRAHNVPKPASEPMPGPTTATGGGLFALDGELEAIHLGQHGGNVARPQSQPFSTFTQDGAASVVTPIVSPYHGDKDGRVRASRTSNDPLATPDTANRFALVTGEVDESDAVVLSFERETDGRPSRPRKVDEPVGGILTRDRFSLLAPVVDAMIVPASSEGATKRLDAPVDTPTTRGGPKLVEPYLVTTNHAADGNTRAQRLDETIPARTARNGEAIVEAFLTAHFGEREGQTPRCADTDGPFWSVTPRGAGDLVQAALERVESINPALRERLLIGQDGRVYVAHLHFRMLHPKKELAPAMGFPRDYKWPDSNTVVTKLVGNAVHVDWADAIVSAFLSDLVPARERARDDAGAGDGAAA